MIETKILTPTTYHFGPQYRTDRARPAARRTATPPAWVAKAEALLPLSLAKKLKLLTEVEALMLKAARTRDHVTRARHTARAELLRASIAFDLATKR